jgi:hypothetical protein
MVHSRNFPTSTHYFPDLIKHDAVYVDKTQFIVPLMKKEYNSNFFLSRPRRFGKSLFVSTLEQVFLGKKELFKGLYIEDKIDWETYPVVRISMDKIGFTELGLEKALTNVVHKIAKNHNINLNETSAGLSFEDLISQLSKKCGKKVVVLIDEYDKPIIQYVEKDNTIQAELNRDILKSFYGILKDSGEYLRFVFITGISKFGKVSIFSDLNYFTDLTLNAQYATICGFTEAEIRQYCYGGLEDLAAKESTDIEAIVDKMRFWYNGFSWNAVDFVYNPYSSMHLMEHQSFKNYWFESGTPSFLVKILNKSFFYKINNIKIKSSIYDWYDLRELDPLSIMLQTGYLTLKKHLGEDYYIVNYPNKEVEYAFNEMLLGGYLHKHPARIAVTVLDIQEAIEKHDLEQVIQIIKDIFGTLPSHFFTESKEITDAQGNTKTVSKAVGESFYHAIIYLIFNILGVRMNVEVTTQKGRIDAVVETEKFIYIFEFKVNRKANVAVEQIVENNYAQQFALSKKVIYLIGVGFNLRKKGVSDYSIIPYSMPPQ